MRAADVDSLEVRDTAVARCYCDVHELYVHVVLGWGELVSCLNIERVQVGDSYLLLVCLGRLARM